MAMQGPKWPSLWLHMASYGCSSSHSCPISPLGGSLSLSAPLLQHTPPISPYPHISPPIITNLHISPHISTILLSSPLLSHHISPPSISFSCPFHPFYIFHFILFMPSSFSCPFFSSFSSFSCLHLSTCLHHSASSSLLVAPNNFRPFHMAQILRAMSTYSG